MLIWRSLTSLSPHELPLGDFPSDYGNSVARTTALTTTTRCTTPDLQLAAQLVAGAFPPPQPSAAGSQLLANSSSKPGEVSRFETARRSNSVLSLSSSDEGGTEYFSADDALCNGADNGCSSEPAKSLGGELSLPSCCRSKSYSSASSSSRSSSSCSISTRRYSRSASSSTSTRNAAALHLYVEHTPDQQLLSPNSEKGSIINCRCCSETSSLENSYYRSNPKQPRLAVAAAVHHRRLQHILLQKTLRHLYAKGTLPRGVKLARVSSSQVSPRTNTTKVAVGSASDESDFEGATEWSSSVATTSVSRRLSRASAATEGSIFERARSFSFKLQQECLGMLRDSWSASARTFSFYRSNGSRSGSSTRSSSLTKNTDDFLEATFSDDDEIPATAAACLVPFLSGDEDLEETSPNALAERVSLEIRQRRLQRDRISPPSYHPVILPPLPSSPCIFNSGSYIALPHQPVDSISVGSRNSSGALSQSDAAAATNDDNEDDCNNSWMIGTTWHLSLPSLDSPYETNSSASRRKPLLDRPPSCRSRRSSTNYQHRNFAARFLYATFARSECERVSSSSSSFSPTSSYIRNALSSDDSSGNHDRVSNGLLHCSAAVEKGMLGPTRRLSIQDVTDRVLFDNYVLAQRERTLSWLEVPLCTFVD